MAKRGGKILGPNGEVLNGRKLGSKNKATVEREELERQQRALMEQRNSAAAPPPKLGKEVLEELYMVAFGYAALHQPVFDPVTMTVSRGNESKFEKWATLAAEWASRAAKYQSPTFKAIAYAEVPKIPAVPFTGAHDAPDGQPMNVVGLIEKMDPQAAMATYQRLVRAGGSKR